MSLRIRYDKELEWVVFEASDKGIIYRQVILPAMLEQCYDPARVVVDMVNTMKFRLGTFRG